MVLAMDQIAVLDVPVTATTISVVYLELLEHVVEELPGPSMRQRTRATTLS